MERVMGIEPTRPAWKAGILPLNYTRTSTINVTEYILTQPPSNVNSFLGISIKNSSKRFLIFLKKSIKIMLTFK